MTLDAKSANDALGIALIGCGGRGMLDAKEASPFSRVVVVCDVDEHHARAAQHEYPQASIERDFRKTVSRRDVDVVINATPDHWHTLVNLSALKAGKDVFTEKPLTLTIDEGKRVVDAVRRTGRVLQVGSQQRSEAEFRLACELVRNGRLGKLREITVYLPAGLNGGPFAPQPVPEGLNWDMWQGQAPATQYVPQRCHATFRYWYDYSGGTMTDWGAHHNDIALWAMGGIPPGPMTIEGKPLVDPVLGGYTAASEYRIEYQYANGVRHRCLSTTATGPFGQTLHTGPGTVENGIRFDGTDGWLWVTRGVLETSKPEIIHDPLRAGAVRLPVSTNHKANFFECVRTRKEPIAPAEAGHRAATLCHLGVIALRLGRKLRWDPSSERFIDDVEADTRLARQQRSPWTYEAI